MKYISIYVNKCSCFFTGFKILILILNTVKNKLQNLYLHEFKKG